MARRVSAGRAGMCRLARHAGWSSGQRGSSPALPGVAHLPGGQRAGPLVDLRKAETDCGFKPVLRNLLCSPKPGPDFGDELCLLLRLSVQSRDQGPLFLRPGCKVGNLPCRKPELCP